ncbi:hypothetical protein [Chryseobacterium sp. JK1]|uniref:hypothetical protein n=1 Tax=Chryseobacterium sp. JK1 TaxID=874294 RepID=UPI003D682BC0
MKKIFLFIVLNSSMAFGQFVVSDQSSNWHILGKEVNDTSILINTDVAKIKLIDFRTKTMGFDPLSTFKTKSQQNINNLQSEIRKGNEGVKSGFYEFIFKTEPDTLEKLYDVINSHFETKQKEVVTLTFPEGNLYLDFNSRTMFYAVSFGIDSNDQKIFTAPFIKSQINKLFGKKN